MEYAKKERELATRIIDKHLRQLYVKAIMKGYCLLDFEQFTVEVRGEPTAVRVKDASDGHLRLRVTSTSHLSHDGIDAASDPTLFRDAKAIIDAIDTLLEELPVQERPLMNADNLAVLTDIATGLRNKPSFSIDHVSYKQNGKQRAYSVNLQRTPYLLPDRAGHCLGLLHPNGSLDPGAMDQHNRLIVMECDQALFLMRENRLLMQASSSFVSPTPGADDVIRQSVNDSLIQDLAEVFPDSGELDRAYGPNLHRLLKPEQIKLFREIGTDGDTVLSTEIPEVSVSVYLSLDKILEARGGPFKSWKEARECLIVYTNESLKYTVFRLPAGGDPSGTIALYGAAGADMGCLFIALNRVVNTGGEADPDAVMAYVRAATRGLAENVAETFRNAMATGERQAMLIREAVEPVMHRKAVRDLADTIAKCLAAFNQVRGFSPAEAGLDTAQHFQITSGWYYSVYLSEARGHVTSSRLLHVPDGEEPPGTRYSYARPPSVDFHSAQSKAVIQKKILAMTTGSHGQDAAVHRLLGAILNNGTLERLETDMLSSAIEANRKKTSIKDQYYEVFQKDFSEDLMEEYVHGPVV